MKKTILLLTLLTLFSKSAYSEEAESELIEAPEEYTISLLRLCKDYAQEDEISQSAINAYLLICINDELESSDYKTIKVLPKDDEQEG